MSGFTITGSMTFDGGFDIPFPASPPSTVENTAAWFGGGYVSPGGGSRSTVDRITYATDTATASVRGPLSLARYLLAAAGGIQ